MFEYLFYVALVCVFVFWIKIVRDMNIKKHWNNSWLSNLIMAIILTPLTPLILLIAGIIKLLS